MDPDEKIIYAYNDFIIISQQNIVKILELSNNRSHQIVLHINDINRIQLLGLKKLNLYFIDNSQNLILGNFEKNKREMLYKFRKQEFYPIQNRLGFEGQNYLTNHFLLGDDKNIFAFQVDLKRKKIVRRRKLYLLLGQNIQLVGHINLYQFYIINNYNILILNSIYQTIQVIQRFGAFDESQFFYLKKQQNKQEQEKQKQDQKEGLTEISQYHNYIRVILYNQLCSKYEYIYIYNGEQQIEQYIKFNNISINWDNDFRYILFQNTNYCMICDQSQKKDYPLPTKIVCFNSEKYVIYIKQENYQQIIFKIAFDSLEPVQYHIYDEQYQNK